MALEIHSAALGLLPAEDHAGGRRARDQLALGVCDVAINHADGTAALDHFTHGAELFLPDRAQEIDFQFEGGEGFAVRERGGEGDAHGGVGDVAEDASVQGAHGVRVRLIGFEFNDGLAMLNGGEAKAD